MTLPQSFRSFILIRQIAKVYGVRPSFSTTMVLLRHIMTTMATTMAAASLVNQAVEFAAKIHPMVENFARKSELGVLRQLEFINSPS